MKGAHAQGNRHSLGIYKEETTTDSSTFIKDQISIQNGNTQCKLNDESKEAEGINESFTTKVNGEGNVVVDVHS